MMRLLSILLAVDSAFFSGFIQVASAGGPRVLLAESGYDFGSVLYGSQIEHGFRIKNQGPGPLRLSSLRLTPPLESKRMPLQIPPGDEESIILSLDTSGLMGPFDGEAVVNLSDPTLPEIRFAFKGTVKPPIELLPLFAFFVTTQRGQSEEKSIEITSYEQEPLAVFRVDHPTDRFSTRLETIEAGKRYRLILAIKPDGPGGSHTDMIKLRTSSATVPVLEIPANTHLRERVYTFPDLIDLGSVPLSQLAGDPSAAGKLARMLSLYQVGGSSLEAEFSTDLPMVQIVAERAWKGDCYHATVALIPEKLRAGPLSGSIHIRTNDPEFPSLTVPLTGTILDR